MLYKVALTLEYVDNMLKCDYSNENYWAVLSCGAVYYAVILCLWTKSLSVAIRMKDTQQYLAVVLFINMLSKAFLSGPFQMKTIDLYYYVCYTWWLNFWVCEWNPKV